MSLHQRLFITAALTAAAGVPSLASAQSAGSPSVDAFPSKTQQPLPTPEPVPANNVNNGALHFGADLNFATSYFFRGYNQEDTGLIFQPNVYGTVDFLTDVDPSSMVNAATLKVGAWNSVHSEQTAGDGVWYESDLYAVLTFKFQKTLYASVGYTLYTYPDDAFEAIHELGVSGGIELSSLWDDSDDRPFTLPVEVGFYRELDDGNGEEDFYAELKLTPTLATTFAQMPGFGKATVTFPIVVGTSLDGFYLDEDGGNEFLGYAQAGVAVGLPMTFIDPKYGNWTLNAGVNYIHLFADSAELANDGGTDYEVQGVVGISMAY